MRFLTLRRTATALTALLAGLAPLENKAAAPAAPNKGDESDKGAPQGPPNILIIMLDDAGFAQADTVGGAIHTPTLSRIAESGILYNSFHTTAISSATRASLLTGRNHHRVGNGTITELANQNDGYTGIIPDDSATLPEILHQHGYASAAFGKWHNTPTGEVTSTGPFNHWPTGYGFDHFYGFLGGESDQYHPHLFNDTTPVDPPNDPTYHLSVDIADQAIRWIDQQHQAAPKKPFLLYWAPGAVHAPHQIFKEWADKYKGKFDNGWDAYRDRAFEKQKALGWIPESAGTTPRPAEMPAWDSLTPKEKAFQAREMEVYAGFLEHVDTQAGRVVDELERLGLRDNTLIFYILSDNGASSEGMQGAINDVVAMQGVTTTLAQHMDALDRYYGGLDALGGPKVLEHYSAAWAWAGESPFVGTKLVAGYFGGTRTPMAISWPAHVHHDGVLRQQFHHVNDIAPTIYDVLGITPPATYYGVPQAPIDGVSMAYSFDHPDAATHKARQYFEIMGSRGEYADGWMASVFGPRTPWVADQSHLLSLPGKISLVLHQPWISDWFGYLNWKPENDKWALYDLHQDFSQAKDVAAEHPEKLAELRRMFDEDAAANKVTPIGASFYTVLHPREDKRTDWHFGADMTRLLEFNAPNIKSRDNRITIDADLPQAASGVLLALGGVSGGITLFVDQGVLTYEYNSFGLVRTRVTSKAPLPAGHAVIEADLSMQSIRRGGPARVKLKVNGAEIGAADIPITAPLAFSATETMDIGQDTGSAVSLAYFDRAPFKFDGVIHDVHIELR